jgi:hypothetical protein
MIDSRATAQRQIENYALIGNCETAALVGRDGSIDWLCWPRFDSGACFAALLGGPEHGRWLIAPRDPGARITRRYLDGSLIHVPGSERIHDRLHIAGCDRSIPLRLPDFVLAAGHPGEQVDALLRLA